MILQTSKENPLSHNKQKHASSNPFMILAIARFHEQVRRMLPPTAESVLEVGCGEGYSAKALFGDDANIPLFGGDVDLYAAKEANKRFPPMRYMQFDATQLPLSDKCVDATFSLEVLEHLPDPIAAIREIKRVTRRYALLSVPNDPTFRLLRFLSGKGWQMWGDHPEHIQHWTTAQFVAFLRSQSLNVVAVASPFPYAWSIVLIEL